MLKQATFYAAIYKVWAQKYVIELGIASLDLSITGILIHSSEYEYIHNNKNVCTNYVPII